MPSPIGHILAGAAVYFIGTGRKEGSNLVLGVTLLGSIVPDFDFFPGFLIGNAAAFHHGISHSAGFALLFGIIVFLVLRYFQPSDISIRAALMAAVAYLFHAVLDAVSVGEGAKAVPLLWPFLNREFGVNLGLFGHFHHDGLVDGIWSVIRRENLAALGYELTVLGIPALLIYLWTAKSVNTRLRGKQALQETTDEH